VTDLESYFTEARGVEASERRVGIEVETLFVDGHDVPLSPSSAEEVFVALGERGWSAGEDEATGGREWRRGGFVIKPEVGAGNLELISPPRSIGLLDSLLDDVGDHLDSLYSAAEAVGARPVFDAHDGAPQIDNIILDNERDRRWAAIDGREALRELAHIASVHVTFGLRSIDEGFACIRELEDLASARGWPPGPTRASWARYLERSRCTYAPERFGPAPESFDEYLDLLRGFRVVVDRDADGGLTRFESPPRLGEVEGEVDLATFLGTVWLYTRLRRLGGELALEVRFVPRGSDEALRDDVRAVLSCAGIG
jgi:hypothetical protein